MSKKKTTPEATDVTESTNPCPTCGKSSKKPKTIGVPICHKFNGTHDGKRYSVVKSQRVICQHCGQLFIERTYE